MKKVWTWFVVLIFHFIVFSSLPNCKKADDEVTKPQKVDAIIEDATESLGASYQGQYTGTFGDFGAFSFNGNKIITTGGGGMLVGQEPERLEHIKFLVNQARDASKGYYHTEIGFNYRMTNIEAALGLAQMQQLDDFLTKKREFHNIYREELKKVKRVMAKLDASAPHEVMQVLDAGTGQNALNQAKQFHEALCLTGITVTKLDVTAKGGILLAIAKQMGTPIRFIGVGEAIEDLREFNAAEFSEALLDVSSNP